MGEKESNGTGNGDRISTIAPEDIFIITELAQIGHHHLKQMLPEIREVVAKGGAAITSENLSHLESIVSEGADTIVHFSNMCQYMEDAAKKLCSPCNEDSAGSKNV